MGTNKKTRDACLCPPAYAQRGHPHLNSRPTRRTKFRLFLPSIEWLTVKRSSQIYICNGIYVCAKWCCIIRDVLLPGAILVHSMASDHFLSLHGWFRKSSVYAHKTEPDQSILLMTEKEKKLSHFGGYIRSNIGVLALSLFPLGSQNRTLKKTRKPAGSRNKKYQQPVPIQESSLDLNAKELMHVLINVNNTGETALRRDGYMYRNYPVESARNPLPFVAGKGNQLRTTLASPDDECKAYER
jgi:hypothetical protein